MVPAKVLLTLGAAALIAMLLLRRRAQRRDSGGDGGDDSPGSSTGWLRGLLQRNRAIRPEPRHRRSRPRLALTVSGVARPDEQEATEPADAQEPLPASVVSADVPDVPHVAETGAVSAPGWPEPGELALGVDEDHLDPTPAPDDGPFEVPEGAEDAAWTEDDDWVEDDDWAAGEPLAQVAAEAGPAEAFAFADGEAWQPPEPQRPDLASGRGDDTADGADDGFDPATGWLDADAESVHPPASGAATPRDATSASDPGDGDAVWEDDGTWSATEWDAPVEDEPTVTAEPGDPVPPREVTTDDPAVWTSPLPAVGEALGGDAPAALGDRGGSLRPPGDRDIDAVWVPAEDAEAADAGGAWAMPIPAVDVPGHGAETAAAPAPADPMPEPSDAGHTGSPPAVPDAPAAVPVGDDADAPPDAWSVPVEPDAEAAAPAPPLIVDIVGLSDAPLSLAIAPGDPGEEPTAWLVSGDWNVAVDGRAVRLTPPGGGAESPEDGGMEPPAAGTRTIEARLEAAERELERIARLTGIPVDDGAAAAAPVADGERTARDPLTEMVQQEANRRVAEVLDRHGAVSDNGDVDGLVARLSELSDPPTHPGG